MPARASPSPPDSSTTPFYSSQKSGESQAFASFSLLNVVDGKWRFVDILPSLDTNGFSQALALMKLPGQ